jgi:hypothetical protein
MCTCAHIRMLWVMQKQNLVQSLLSEFLSYNPKFIENLKDFDDQLINKFLKKLRSEKDKPNFRSTIAEIQFGKLLKSLNLDIKYDLKYKGNLTPDWTVCDGNCSALIEVYRLGKSSDSQTKSDFEDKILMTINKIKKPYIIQLSFTNQDYNSSLYNLDKIIEEIQLWLTDERTKSEKKIFQDIVELCIYCNNSKYNHACIIGSVSSIDFKTQKLKQNPNHKPNEISKKITKYRALIENNNLPYFIAVSMDFTSGFDFDDFREYFLGTGVFNADFGKIIPEYPENNNWGENWTELGKFYELPHLSGLILRYNNEYKILLNPLKSQVIYSKKYESLLNKLNSLKKSTYPLARAEL